MEYINKIYKESNLELNDSVSTYNGWGAQQNPNTFEAFHNFLREIKPKRILEIGTSIGGLTTFIDYTCKLLELDCKLISFDVNELSYYRHMRDNGIDIRVENIFSDEYSIVKEEMIDFQSISNQVISLWLMTIRIIPKHLMRRFIRKFGIGMRYVIMTSKMRVNNII